MVAFSFPLSEPVLIADDNTDDVFSLRRRLRAAGVRGPIHDFRSAHEVMAYLRQVTAGQAAARILFLDIAMPGASGFSVLCWLREQEALDGVRVVMTSGSDDPADVALANSLGADAYLPKTHDFPTLANVLEKLLVDPNHPAGESGAAPASTAESSPADRASHADV